MKAQNFDLLGVDGKRYSPVAARGESGLLVMFICNHCPYVKAVLDRIIRDTKELASQASARSPSCRTIPRTIRRTRSTT